MKKRPVVWMACLLTAVMASAQAQDDGNGAYAEDPAGAAITDGEMAGDTPSEAASGGIATDDTAAADAASDSSSDTAVSEVPEPTADASMATDEATETAASDVGGSAETSGGGASADEPVPLYLGADYVWTTASFSKTALKTAFGSDQLDSGMYRLRAGIRLFDQMGAEVQFGIGTTDSESLGADEYRTDRFYGIYLVPTGVLFDLIEVSASVGYAQTDLERANASESLGGVSFGVNADLPLYVGDEWELRIGGGGTVFRAQNSARIYGYHAGLRIDFKI